MASAEPAPHPDAYRTVGIIGGGTAGYLTALALGSGNIPARRTIVAFHEGVGWVAQIGLFVLAEDLLTLGEGHPYAQALHHVGDGVRGGVGLWGVREGHGGFLEPMTDGLLSPDAAKFVSAP